MQDLFLKWRDYLKEVALLSEAKKDVKLAKAKFADEPLFLNAIEYFEKNDPSDNQKYFNWMLSQLVDEINRSMEAYGKTPGSQFLENFLEDLVHGATRFHQLNDKTLAWVDGQDKPLPRDIYNKRYKKDFGLDQLLFDTERASKRWKKIQKDRETQKKLKSKAKKDSDVIYDSENYMVIHPRSEEASCFYGMGTKWCISATEAENYFNDYTARGKSFYFVIDKKRPQNDPLKKVAWVGNDKGKFEEWYDAPDDSIPREQAFNQVSADDEYSITAEVNAEGNEIVSVLEKHLEQNPPARDFIRRARDLVRDYNLNRGKNSRAIVQEIGTDTVILKFDTSYVLPGVYTSEYKQKKEDIIEDALRIVLKGNNIVNFKQADDSEDYTTYVQWTKSLSSSRPEEAEIKLVFQYYPLMSDILGDGIENERDLKKALELGGEVFEDEHEGDLYSMRKSFLEEGWMLPGFNDKLYEKYEDEEGPYLWDNVIADVSDGWAQYQFLIPGIDVESKAGKRMAVWGLRQRNKWFAQPVIDAVTKTARGVQLDRSPMPEDRDVVEFDEWVNPQDLKFRVFGDRGALRMDVTVNSLSKTNKAQEKIYKVMEAIEEKPKEFEKNIAKAINKVIDEKNLIDEKNFLKESSNNRTLKIKFRKSKK